MKLSEKPLKVLTKKCQVKVQNKLTLSLLFFMGFDNKFKINLFLEHFLGASG